MIAELRLLPAVSPRYSQSKGNQQMFRIPRILHLPAAALLFGLALIPAQTSLAVAHPAVDVAVANWKFTPNKIEAHVGEATTLRFTSSEGVHGVESSDLGIPKTTIMPGKLVEVTFTPKKAGTYVVQCAIMCGDGHDKMALTIEVKP
jgi:heme/copper-type cytochrome/quinol oxidase subunit 2